MKSRARIVFAAIAGIFLVSLSPPAARAAVEENVRIPVEIEFEIPCANGGAGEIVVLTGDLHVVTSFVINGNVVRGRFHYQPQGISGFGTVTGDQYHATGVTQGEFKSTMKNGEALVSLVNNFRIIGQGPGNNFLVHENMHLAINTNGDIATSVDHLGADCK